MTPQTPLTADDLAAIRNDCARGILTDPDDTVRLLDMVAGYQTLVRLATNPDEDLYFHEPDSKWRVYADGDWHYLAERHPTLAALLDLALTPLSDAPLPGDHP